MEQQAAASFPGAEPSHDCALRPHDLEVADGGHQVGESRCGCPEVSLVYCLGRSSCRLQLAPFVFQCRILLYRCPSRCHMGGGVYRTAASISIWLSALFALGFSSARAKGSNLLAVIGRNLVLLVIAAWVERNRPRNTFCVERSSAAGTHGLRASPAAEPLRQRPRANERVTNRHAARRNRIHRHCKLNAAGTKNCIQIASQKITHTAMFVSRRSMYVSKR